MWYVRAFVVLLSLHAIDIAVGIVAATREKELQSAKLRDGLFKKVGFIVCYCVAYLVDEHAIDVGVAMDVAISPVLAAYVFFTELVSILENIARINPTLLPDRLLEMFHVKHFE